MLKPKLQLKLIKQRREPTWKVSTDSLQWFLKFVFIYSITFRVKQFQNVLGTLELKVSGDRLWQEPDR